MFVLSVPLLTKYYRAPLAIGPVAGATSFTDNTRTGRYSFEINGDIHSAQSIEGGGITADVIRSRISLQAYCHRIAPSHPGRASGIKHTETQVLSFGQSFRFPLDAQPFCNYKPLPLIVHRQRLPIYSFSSRHGWSVPDCITFNKSISGSFKAIVGFCLPLEALS